MQKENLFFFSSVSDGKNRAVNRGDKILAAVFKISNLIIGLHIKWLEL